MSRWSAVLLLLASASAWAEPGTSTIGFGSPFSSNQTVHSWAGSKYFLVGTYYVAADNFIGITRFNANGSYDTTFGTGGFGSVQLKVGASSTAVASDEANSSLLTAGSFVNSSTGCTQPLLTRWLGSGAPDTSFGSNGVVRGSFASCVNKMNGTINDVKINDSSQILVVGSSSSSGAVVARYTWGGTLDTSFGASGLVDVQALLGLSASANLGFGSLRLWNGKIILAGWARASSGHYQWMIVRLTGSGALDTSFNGTGWLSPSPVFQNHDEVAYWALPISGGSIVVVGIDESQIILRRYLSSGAADATFADQGLQLLGGPPGVTFTNPRIDSASQGRYVVGATVNTPQVNGDVDQQFQTWRLLSNGQTDITFGNSGQHDTFFFDITPHEDTLWDLFVDSSDRVIMVGDASGEGGIARLTASGFQDPLF